MTDFLVTSPNQASLPLAKDKSWQESDNIAFERDINLKDALVNLLKTSEEEDGHASDSQDDQVSPRSLDLLVWLMNLELRLNPYGDMA